MLVYNQLLSCAPAQSGISFAVASPVTEIHSKMSLISNQPALTILTHGLGTRGPSPASPEQGVQHLEHKRLSARILACLCRAPPCSLCNCTLLILLGSHSVWKKCQEQLGKEILLYISVRETKATSPCCVTPPLPSLYYICC